MPNHFDEITLSVINKIDAQIELGDGNPIQAEMGSSVLINLLYIGGTRKPATGFRLRTYASPRFRELDAEEDIGRGLLAGNKAPQNIIFTPDVPVPGGGYDHDDNPNTPALLRPVTLAFDVPDAINFVGPSQDPERPGDEPQALNYYMKITILQEDDDTKPANKGFSGGHQLLFGPAIIIVNTLFGNPAGGMTVIFNAVEGWDGAYEGRIGIADREGAVGEWLDILATPDPADHTRRRLFGVFDARTLEQYYEGAKKLTPGERLELYVEIQNRYPPDTSPPTGSRINRGRTFFVYPFDVRQPSQPTQLRKGKLSTPYSPLSPRIRFLWDFPADLGISRVRGRGASVPIDYFEYRYKLDTETFFGEWVNNGNVKEVTLTLPPQYDGGNLVFEVRGVNTTTSRDPATRNFADLKGYIASVTARIGPTKLPPPEPPEPDPTIPQYTDSQRLGHIKNTDNWTRIGRGGKVYTYVDGGTAIVRNVPRGTRRVTFVGVPTLKSPITKTGETDNVQTLFRTALASLTSNDQA